MTKGWQIAAAVVAMLVLTAASRGDAESEVADGWKAIKSKDYDLALSHAEAAVKEDPKSADGYTLMGWSYLLKNDGHNEQALAAFSSAIRLDKDIAIAHHGRGGCYWNKGERDKSIDSFGEAIRLDPKNADLYQERGDRYKDLRNNDAAEADYRKAKQLRGM